MSPTLFSQQQNQLREERERGGEGGERDTPSPTTRQLNQSFQQHLDSLDAETKLRKRKVMDWIQRSNTEAWERENTKKEDGDPAKLKLDPGSNVPSQPYQKQLPIYATLNDPDPTTVSEPVPVPGPEPAPVPVLEPASTVSGRIVRNRTSDSVPSQSQSSREWRAGGERQFGMESRQRAVTVSGGKVEPMVPPGLPQRRYPMPPRHNTGGMVPPSLPQGGWGAVRGNPRLQQHQGVPAGSHMGMTQQGVPTGHVGVAQQVRGARQYTPQHWSTQNSMGPTRGGQGYSHPQRNIYPAPQGQGMPPRGPGVNQQNIDPSKYPTAKFGKDYYVLDV